MNKRQKKKQKTMEAKKSYRIYKRNHNCLRKLLSEKSYQELLQRTRGIWGGSINPAKRRTACILRAGRFNRM